MFDNRLYLEFFSVVVVLILGRYDLLSFLFVLGATVVAFLAVLKYSSLDTNVFLLFVLSVKPKCILEMIFLISEFSFWSEDSVVWYLGFGVVGVMVVESVPFVMVLEVTDLFGSNNAKNTLDGAYVVGTIFVKLYNEFDSELRSYDISRLLFGFSVERTSEDDCSCKDSAWFVDDDGNGWVNNLADN